MFQFILLKCSINTYTISFPWEYWAHFAGTLCSVEPQMWVDNNTEEEALISFLALHDKSQLFTEKSSITVTSKFHLDVDSFYETKMCILLFIYFFKLRMFPLCEIGKSHLFQTRFCFDP